jgi:hypothetical protein
LLDKQEGWTQLATTIANHLGLAVAIDETPLLGLASRFSATSNALVLRVRGMTIEMFNDSSSPISDVQLVTADGEPLPSWAKALTGRSVPPKMGISILRQADPEEHRWRLSWTDVIGANHSRDVTIQPTT